MLGKTRIHQLSEAYHESLKRIFDIAHPTKLLRHSPVKVRKATQTCRSPGRSGGQQCNADSTGHS